MRKLARVGRPRRRSARSDRTSGSASTGAGTPIPSAASDSISPSSRSSSARCQASRGDGARRASDAAEIAAVHEPIVCGRESSSAAAWTRSRSSAKRPARSTSPLSTSSSGSTPPTSGSPSSDIVTPSSRRSRPARHVLASSSSSRYGARWVASRPQRMPVALIHSSILARSSSSRRNLRRTGSRPAKSSSCEVVEARVGQLEELGDGGEQRVGLAQRPIGEADPEVGQATVSGVGAADDVPLAERGLDERGEDLDVRAHHDDVAWLERRIVGEQVEDRIAHHLDLAGTSMARVDLHAVVGRREGQPFVRCAGERLAGRGDVGTHARPGSAAAGSRRGDRPAASEGWWTSACSPLVGRTSCTSLASRPHEARTGLRTIVEVGSSRRRTAVPTEAAAASPAMRPQRSGDGWSRRRWTSRAAARASSTSTTLGASRVKPNSERRAGNATSVGLVAQPGARRTEPFGRAGNAELLAQAAPQRGLPGDVGREGLTEAVGVVPGQPTRGAWPAGGRRSGRRGRPGGARQRTGAPRGWPRWSRRRARGGRRASPSTAPRCARRRPPSAARPTGPAATDPRPVRSPRRRGRR